MYIPLIKNEEKCAGQLSYGFNIQDKLCKFSDSFKGDFFCKIDPPITFLSKIENCNTYGDMDFLNRSQSTG